MSVLVIESHEGVRLLRLNRPERHNALNTALTQGLLDALRAADEDDAVRAIVLTGNGPSFCAGADTTEFSGLTANDPSAVALRADLTTTLHRVFPKISKPIVGAVHGNALGGGAGLALACDITIVAQDVRYGYPELKHGIVAAVVMANLVRQVGRKHAFELLADARPIDGARAVQLGIANSAVAATDVLPQAMAQAQRLAQWNPAALALTKRTFYRSADLALDPALDLCRDANVMMRGLREAGAA